MFGVSSDTSEAAKALLYPHPTDADMKVTTKVVVIFTIPGGFYESTKSPQEKSVHDICMSIARRLPVVESCSLIIG